MTDTHTANLVITEYDTNNRRDFGDIESRLERLLERFADQEDITIRVGDFETGVSK